MDIAAQELNRVRGRFASGVADNADQISALWTERSNAVPRTRHVGSDLVTVSQEDGCDGTFGKQRNRRNHGATGSRVRCRGEQDPTAAP